MMLSLIQQAADPPWGLASTAAGVAILLVCIFLKFISVTRKDMVAEQTAQREATAVQMKEQRVAHTEEMKAQRELFTGTLVQINKTNAESAERVETALRDLAVELRSKTLT